MKRQSAAVSNNQEFQAHLNSNMESISDFVSQKDEVKRLNQQIDMIAGFYFNFYESQVSTLKSKLNTALKAKSEYKRKSELIKPPTRKENVFDMLNAGVKDYKLIAKKCSVTYGVVKNYACELNKANNND